MDELIIIGGGLAGCEAAWQAAQRGIHVLLFEMRPEKMTEAHKTPSPCGACMLQFPQIKGNQYRSRTFKKGAGACRFACNERGTGI